MTIQDFAFFIQFTYKWTRWSVATDCLVTPGFYHTGHGTPCFFRFWSVFKPYCVTVRPLFDINYEPLTFTNHDRELFNLWPTFTSISNKSANHAQKTIKQQSNNHNFTVNDKSEMCTCTVHHFESSQFDTNNRK